MTPFRTAALRAGVIAACLFVSTRAGYAATPLMSLRSAADITVALDGTTVTPANVAEDNLASTVTLVDIGSIPADVHVDAYQLLADGDQLLSFDTTVSLSGGVVACPADVVRFDGSTYTIEFNAAANGIPEGVNTDAVAISEGDLVLSFDTSVTLSGTAFEDEDLVRFTGAAGGGTPFTPFFIGSRAGVPSDLDLDGAQVIGTNHLLVSFDGSGAIGGVDFNDDDVLEYDSGNWEVAYRGAAHHAGWEAADLVALYAVPVAPSPTPTPTGAAATSTATSTPTPPVTATETTTPLPSGSATPTPESTPTDTPPQSVTPTVTPIACVGDCNGDGQVTVDDLIKMVNIALGTAPISGCLAGDVNGSGEITIDEIIVAINRALDGC